MKARFERVRISGIATIVPPKVIDIDSELHSIYKGDEKALARIKKVIGLQTRHIAEPHITASDMGEAAAKQILQATHTQPSEIDALLVVTQTPDYILPATACYLHGKLGLPTSCLSFDINQACAGYLYGLYVAHSLIESRAARKVLLIVGDTLSRYVNPLDSNLAPIIGDGVSATILESRHDKGHSASLGNSAFASGHSALSDKSAILHSDFRLRTSSARPQSSLESPDFSSQILECQTESFLKDSKANSESTALDSHSISESSLSDSVEVSESHPHANQESPADSKQNDEGRGFVAGLYQNDILDSTILESTLESSPAIPQGKRHKAAFFELGTQGDKFYQLIIPEGASRIPTREIITESKVWETSQTRTLRQLYMDGAEIFNFAVMQYPKTFKAILDFSGECKEGLDYCFFHQANKYIVDNITRALGLEKGKVPNTTTSKYGNLSGCSVPATICDTLGILKPSERRDLRVHLAGFGAGLAWGNAVLSIDRECVIRKVGIYECL